MRTVPDQVRNAAGLQAYFLGRWTFLRTMQSREGVPLGSAEGTATFTQDQQAAVLHYHEAGQLHLLADARIISFSRRFTYRLQQDLWQVAFADGPQAGQDYQHYRFDPVRQTLLPLAAHVCVQDHYDGSYRLHGPNRFALHTRIDGPHKDYLLVSHFTRAAE